MTAVELINAHWDSFWWLSFWGFLFFPKGILFNAPSFFHTKSN